MAQQEIIESSGNAQNVLFLSLSLLFINDILNRNEDEHSDYETDYDEDYEDDYDYNDDYEGDYTWMYGLLALWTICFVLCCMLCSVIQQDPLAEDPSSTYLLFVNNWPISILCMAHQILMFTLLGLITIITDIEHRVATSYVNAAKSHGKREALLVHFVMSAITLLANVYLLFMRCHFQKTSDDEKIMICLLLEETILTYMMIKMIMT